MLENVQENRVSLLDLAGDSRLDLAGDLRLQGAKSSTRAKHARS